MLSYVLWVLYSAPSCFAPGTPVFPSPQKPTFPNSNSAIRNLYFFHFPAKIHELKMTCALFSILLTVHRPWDIFCPWQEGFQYDWQRKMCGPSSCPGPHLDTPWICKWLTFIKWSSLFSLLKGKKNFEQRLTTEPNFPKKRICLQGHCHGGFGQNIIISEEILFVQELLLAQQNGNCWRQTKLLSFVLYLRCDNNQQQFWKRLSPFGNLTSKFSACILFVII